MFYAGTKLIIFLIYFRTVYFKRKLGHVLSYLKATAAESTIRHFVKEL